MLELNTALDLGKIILIHIHSVGLLYSNITWELRQNKSNRCMCGDKRSHLAWFQCWFSFVSVCCQFYWWAPEVSSTSPSHGVLKQLQLEVTFSTLPTMTMSPLPAYRIYLQICICDFVSLFFWWGVMSHTFQHRVLTKCSKIWEIRVQTCFSVVLFTSL